jgi:diguanylate cyclase (GGDEF)-like protein
MTFAHKTFLWFMLAILLLMADVILVYRSFTQFDSQKNLVTHTYEVINTLEEVVSSLKDVQSAQRGYVITGQLDYLTPYSVAVPRIPESLHKLEVLVADNKTQEKNLALLRQEAEKRMQIAADIIAAYEQKGQEAAFALVRSGAGKKEMDQIRGLVAEMISIEQRLLALRQDKVDAAAEVTLSLGSMGVILCVVILGAVFIMIHRLALRRERAEKQAQAALVEIRTVSEQDALISHMTDYLQSCRKVLEAYDVVAKSLPQILPGTSGGIALYNNSRNILETAISWGDAEGARESFTPERCWSLRRGQLHHVHPGGGEPSCAHLPDTAANTLCFPMQAQGDIVGCFYLMSEKPDTINAHIEKAVRRSGEQIALALSNLKLQERLRDQSIRDPLTKLFNRRYLEETMDRELDRARRKELQLGVMVLDIDHFKKYNDTRGHDAGDALLAQFAKLLMDGIRQEDIACRYGGEEFVIIMPGANAEITRDRAQRICDATRRMKITIGSEIFGGVTVSIGVSCYPVHGLRTEDLITIADQALYTAKHSGRDQVRVAEALISEG